MNISKLSLNNFRTEFAQTVKELEQKHGIKIGLGSITYDSDGFRSKMTVLNAGENPSGKSTRELQAEKDFKDYSEFRYGSLTPTDLGKKFRSRGTTYTIIGAMPKSSKYPILGKTGSKTFKFTPEDVINGLIK